MDALTRTSLVPEDSRIFPFYYAPLVVEENGERWIRPMRYHCRGQGKPVEYDGRYPGLYNARRDNLDGYWRYQFGSTHGVMVVNAFYENVSRHAYENRPLVAGACDESWVIEYRPERSQPLTIACLWDRWSATGAQQLLSFAAITDVPPPDIADTGHDRCVVALKAEYVSTWLAPRAHSDAELHHFLSDRDVVAYSHRKAS
ncbi:MAG: SOS response-associated peptidase family protein [Polyangiaceae bacterium]